MSRFCRKIKSGESDISERSVFIDQRKQSTKPPTSLEKEKPSTQQKFSTFSFRHAIIKPSRGTLAKADGRIEQIGLDARTAQLTWRRTSEER